MLPSLRIIIMSILTFYVFAQGIYILLRYNNKKSLLFALVILTTSIWSMFNTLAQLRISTIYLEFLTKSIYYLGFLISMTFYLFCSTLSNKLSKYNIILPISLSIVSMPLYLFTDYIIGDYHINDNSYFWDYGSLFFIFIIEFFYYFLLGIFKLFNKIRIDTLNGESGRPNTILLIIFILGFVPSTFFSIILPMLNIYTYDWISIILIPLWLVFIWYYIIDGYILNLKQNKVEIFLYLLLFSQISILFIISTITELIILLISLIINLILISYIISIQKIKMVNEKNIEKIFGQLKN